MVSADECFRDWRALCYCRPGLTMRGCNLQLGHGLLNTVKAGLQVLKDIDSDLILVSVCPDEFDLLLQDHQKGMCVLQ